MFILYAIPLGIALGYLLGGRLERLAELRFRWAWVAIAGLVVQVVLFSSLVAGLVETGGVGEAIYVGSTVAVLAAVLRNVRLPGMAIVALGALSNLAAIVANGGIMPTTAAALETAGLTADPGFSNSAVLRDPALAPLTDIFALPAGLPLANVFSIGDVLIGLGVVGVIALGMRRAAPPSA
jgi:Family of unknown function (DUF5317)